MGDKKKLPFFYGWVIVAISFITVAVAYSIRFSFAVFYVSILEEFGWSRADTALIFSINIIVYGVFTVIAGMAIDRLDPRKFMTMGAIILAAATASCSLTSQIWQLYILFGVLGPIGAAAAGFVPNIALASRWFIRRRGLAFGIVYLGFSASFITSYGIEHLIAQVGWRDSFLVLGLAMAGIAPLIAIFQRMDPRDKGLLPDGDARESKAEQAEVVTAVSLVVDKKWADKEWTVPKAIKTHRFWFLLSAGLLMWGVAQNLVLAHQVAFAVDEGYSRAFGALIFSLYGVCYAMACLLGFLSDRFGREVMVSLGLTLALLGVLMLILNQGNYTPGFMYAYSVLFGLGYGFAGPAFTSAGADMFQGKHFGAISGVFVMGSSIGGSISPWVGGKIFDMVGTYIPAFYLVMAAQAVAIACIWIAGPRRIRLVAGKVPMAKDRLA